MNDMPNIETRARALFGRACDDIDPATLQRLRQARATALAAPAAPRGRRLLLPAGALAASALALAVAWQQPRQAESPRSGASPVALAAGDQPVADDDVDLYDNLDFYTWLAAQPAVADGGH